jgi:hypothetical protein
MTRRENSQRRRKPSREPADRILVICGGMVTEPDYFDGLKQFCRNPAVRVLLKKKPVDPLTLVRYAVRLRNDSPDAFDDIWCVVDVDEFDLEPAVSLSSREGVSLAVSNPCFETWLLLHFIDCTSAMPCYADVERRLIPHVPNYNKSALEFRRYQDGIAPAVERARRLADRGREHLVNPATGVWPLVQKFDRSVR